MEGRVILRNADMVAVRVIDGTYSVFRLVRSPCAVGIGDVFLGALSSLGNQLLLHSPTETVVEAQIKLAGTLVAAKTKQWLGTNRQRQSSRSHFSDLRRNALHAHAGTAAHESPTDS